MSKVCVVTSTRADYGLLKPLMNRLSKEQGINLSIVATGMHLSPEFGDTFREIETDGFSIAHKIDIQLSADNAVGMTKTMGLATISFSDFFSQVRPDLLVILGDRYEIMAVVLAAANERIPVAHISGGEVTQGAIDDAYRHAITKISMLHFTSTDIYRKRVIQMGESPQRVFNVGALGVENIMTAELLTLEQLSHEIEFDLVGKKYCSVTFHPVTMEDNTSEAQLKELFAAMEQFPSLTFVISKANSDAGGRKINNMFEEFVKVHSNMILVSSLGMKRYLSLLKGATMMIGNSSSGIIEGPASKIATVNIGDRQKGRITAESIIDCEPETSEIVKAIKKAKTMEFQNIAKHVSNPYGEGKTSEKIVKEIQRFLSFDVSTKKGFYDIDFEV